MKRLKKILKWTAVSLGGLLAILLIANAIFVWTTDSRLERQLAAIRAAGDPLTLAELAPKPIPPETNAATYLRQAEPDVVAIQYEMEQWKATEKVPDFWDYFNDKRPMPEKMHKAMNAIYAAHPKAIGLLQQAVNCLDYDPGLYRSSPDEVMEGMFVSAQKLRGDARVLGYRSRLLTIDGNYDEAARMALADLRLARHIDRSPLLVTYLVGLVIRGIAVEDANLALQAGQVSKEVREALDAELAAQEPMKGFAATLRNERAFMLQSFPTRVPARNFWLVSRGLWNMQESACLDLFPVLIANASGSSTYRDAQQVIQRSKSGFAALMSPGLDAAYTAVTRTRAWIRCLRVLNALQTHVPSGSNTIPKLTELGLPAETTTDPFNGEPLHVKKLPQGWLVYSVGRNLEDDGGKVENQVAGDVGVGPPPAAQPDESKKK
jgi:hypothetical protein